MIREFAIVRDAAKRVGDAAARTADAKMLLYLKASVE